MLVSGGSTDRSRYLTVDRFVDVAAYQRLDAETQGLMARQRELVVGEFG